MDILEALAGEAPARSDRKCKVQRWLDSIDPKTPGLEALSAVLTAPDPESEHYRTLTQLLRLVSRLGLFTSDETLAAHRSKRCKCGD